ncbi:hypothetical protein H4R33_001935 [Dimargaris cristalligena]|nr:hypothetical protein H4R33_001935 [Dimargaris cristalligena]
MSQCQPIAQRPDFGRLGSNIPINANCFEIKSFGEGLVHHYSIQFSPAIPSELIWGVFEVFESQQRFKLFKGTYPVFDGESSMYSPVEINPEHVIAELSMEIPRDQMWLDSSPQDKGPKQLKVALIPIKSIDLRSLRKYIAGRIELNYEVQSAISILDVAFHHRPASKYPSAKNSFYMPEGKQTISGGIEIRPGLYQSVCPTQGRVLLNVDVTAAAFYSPGPLHMVLVKCFNKTAPLELLDLTNDEWRKLKKMVKGLAVKLTHRDKGDYVFKIKRIQDYGAD